jgi:FixJ family two-component response regulator
VPQMIVISIVDDDSSVRESTLDLIRSMGFSAEAFGGPDEFLESDFLHKTSCLIADMRMPGMSGLDLHNRLVALGTPIPTILITAFPDDRDRTRALQVGVVSYMAKPFDEGELLASIRAVSKSNG